MKQQKALDQVSIEIVESKCLKNKNLKKCHTRKCFTFNLYNQDSLPCPYYIPPQKERGFPENLNEINGKQIRRMYFNVLIYAYLLILVAIIVTGFLCAKSWVLVFQLILEAMKSMVLIIVPLSILSLLNKHFLGRLVCVVNENGLYCNQKMLQWSQIKRANYNIFINSSARMGYSSIKIEYGKNLSLIIPHAPRSILKEVIKYSPKAKVGLNTGSKFMLGLTISSSILIPIFIFLVEAALKN